MSVFFHTNMQAEHTFLDPLQLQHIFQNGDDCRHIALWPLPERGLCTALKAINLIFGMLDGVNGTLRLDNVMCAMLDTYSACTQR